MPNLFQRLPDSGQVDNEFFSSSSIEMIFVQIALRESVDVTNVLD